VHMMKGYLDTGQQHTTTVTVSGLPSSSNGYTVYMYASGSTGGSNTGIYQISGAGITTSSVTSTYQSSFNGTFTQATAGSPIGNYVVFTIPDVPGFTLSAIPSTSTTGYERAPVNGIQIVPAGPPAGFTISASSSTQTVNAGSSTTYTVNVGAVNGFTGTVNLSASGLPSGATPSFSPTSVSGSGSSTLTVTTTGSTPTGNETLTITGTSGSLTHTATVTLVVTTSNITVNPISIQFVGTGTAMASSEVAGAVAESNWNPAKGASSSSPLGLADSTGTATTATVSWTADGIWAEGLANTSGNLIMMNGYLDNSRQNTTTVTVSGLPSSSNGYTVYVYASGSTGGSNTGIYQISGAGIATSSVTLTYQSSFNGIFTLATASSPIGNYVVFTIPDVPGFRLSAIPSTSTTGYERAPVNGIQIVPIGTTGTAPAAPSIMVQPASQTVKAGQAATFSVVASGTAPLSYQWHKNGTAISGTTSASYTTPATTTTDNGGQFTVVASNSVGSVTSSPATLTVNPAPGPLAASASTLSFGNVNLNTSTILGVKLTNSGSVNLTISNVTISGPGFTASGVSAGLILTAGQTATLNVTFAPAATGSVTGRVLVASNASNSPASITLSGTAVQPVHLATLTWTDSTAVAYNVYRGTVSGGPYTKINASLDATTNFTDTTVQAGQTYYWVVTAVNSSNVESAYSNEVAGTIPTP
jgi:Immunoglobulin domain/Abnormal spindle-like microcephaly-assoc'd, ASPM-SPD-2-Hydin